MNIEVMEKEIKTVGELKKLLSKFDDNMFIHFGTPRHGFEISSCEYDCFSLALVSDQLEDYLDVNDYS